MIFPQIPMNPICLFLFLAALVTAAPVARAEEKTEAVPLTFKMLTAATHKPEEAPVIPEELKKLEGKKVKITGFINPYTEPDNMMKLMLTEAAVGCFFCEPPQENSLVFVRLAEGQTPVSLDNGDTITVEGVLRFMGNEKKDEEADMFLITVDQAKVIKTK